MADSAFARFVFDRKLDRIKKGETFGDLRYRISLYDNAFEAVIHGRKGGGYG